MLWLGLGERYQRDEAQDLSNHLGKVIRLARDGSVPPDNPFVGRAGAQPEIWSYGHRNIQGMAINRSEEHTSELQSLMRISYAVFCLKKKKQQHTNHKNYNINVY